MDPIIAIDKTTHQLRKVSEVENGMRCNCICPECGGALEACQGEQRKYFRHHSNDRKCSCSYESQLHFYSKYIIEQNKSIVLPKWTGRYITLPSRRQVFTKVEVEVVQDSLKPDCLCTYLDENGEEKTLWIEIFNTHAVGDTKTQIIKERGVACVEIEVSGLFPDKEINEDVLKDFLLNRTENRRWINNSYGEAQENYCNNKVETIFRENSMLSFMEETAKDECKIMLFCNVLFYYFMKGYNLDSESKVFLYDYINFYKTRLNFRGNLEKQYFISAIQVLYCCVAQNNNIRWKDDRPKEDRISLYCYRRDLLIKDIRGFVNDILTFKKYII